jgi:hypothetical protein
VNRSDQPVSADFRNNFRAEFLGYVEQHDWLVFTAEDLDFAFNTTIGAVLIKTAVYENLIRARRWIKPFPKTNRAGRAEWSE